MDTIKQDLPAALKLLQNLPQLIDDTNGFIQSLIKKVNSDDFNISGVSAFFFTSPPFFFQVLFYQLSNCKNLE